MLVFLVLVDVFLVLDDVFLVDVGLGVGFLVLVGFFVDVGLVVFLVLVGLPVGLGEALCEVTFWTDTSAGAAVMIEHVSGERFRQREIWKRTSSEHHGAKKAERKDDERGRDAHLAVTEACS